MPKLWLDTISSSLETQGRAKGSDPRRNLHSLWDAVWDANYYIGGGIGTGEEFPSESNGI